jgi:hypothetical protein
MSGFGYCRSANCRDPVAGAGSVPTLVFASHTSPTLLCHASCDGDAELRNPNAIIDMGKSQTPTRSVPYGIMTFALIDAMLYRGIYKSRVRIVML